MFLLTLYGIGTKTAVNTIHSFLESGDNAIEKISYVYENQLAFSGELIDLWSALQPENSVSNITLLDDAEYGSIIKDERGNLYFPANKVDVSKYITRTAIFNSSLKSQNRKFVYIQAPNKMIKGYTPKGVYEYNYSNQNADDFIKGLKKAKVDTLDLRETIKKEKMNNRELFYKTDHHWTTQTAFWTFQKIVELMQKKYGISVDQEHFYTDLENYHVVQSNEVFLGALGRRVGSSISGLDDYTFIEPAFETDYAVYNGVQSLETPIKTGDFTNAIVSQDIILSNDVKANKHASYYEMDYRLLKNSEQSH